MKRRLPRQIAPALTCALAAMLAAPAFGQTADQPTAAPAAATPAEEAPRPAPAPVAESPAAQARSAPAASSAPASPGPAPRPAPSVTSSAAPAAKATPSPGASGTTDAKNTAATPGPSASASAATRPEANAPGDFASSAAPVVSASASDTAPLMPTGAPDPALLAAGAGIVLLGGIVLALRRRKARAGAEEAEQPAAIPAPATAAANMTGDAPAPTQPVPGAAPPPPIEAASETALSDEVVPAASGAAMPAGAVVDGRLPVRLNLEPLRMSATLMATSLTYRLHVANLGMIPLDGLLIGGGMVSAHASLPVEHQLGTDGQTLELLHRIEEIGAGETLVLEGELRLPLPQVMPIRSGDAMLFIPLARFRVEADGHDMTAAFVVGETPPVAAAALLPFRIDLGPRIWNRVSKRLIKPDLGQ